MATAIFLIRPLKKLEQKGYMSGEKASRSFVKSAFEAGLLPLRPAGKLGGLALSKAGEVYTGRPQAGEPHIVERLRASRPVNEALVGRQYVEIAELIDPDAADDAPQHRELADKRRGYRRYGYYKIARALRLADDDPQVGHDQAQQVINIAKEVGTDPSKLGETLSEIEQQQVRRILEP